MCKLTDETHPEGDVQKHRQLCLCISTTCHSMHMAHSRTLTSMSGRGSSQDMVYRKVAGKPEGASVLVSAMMVASCGTRPIHT